MSHTLSRPSNYPACALVAAALIFSSANAPATNEQDPTPIGTSQPSAKADNYKETGPVQLAKGTLPYIKPSAVAIAPAARQPTGALSGRIVFTNGGHGWTADDTNSQGGGAGAWFTQRGDSLEVVEDFGNVDQMNMYVTYCFNAGATVVPMRPVGNQTNEVVLDNDDAGVVFTGTWSNSSSTVFYGTSGDVPYRFTAKSATETATARYTPTIPAAGFYPVYCWTRDGTDRVDDQLYRIVSTGGTCEVRINHRRVGKGWIYLGTYYFNAGASGYVEISNQSSSALGANVFADAIRFGNGMGDVDRGAGVSGKPREDECCRYWIQRAIGQGSSTTIYDTGLDDQSDNVGAPIRMAAQMNSETEGTTSARVFLSFHSNAAGGRGGDGLWNNPAFFPGTNTPNQYRWAELVGREVNDDMAAIGAPPLETSWPARAAGAANVTFYRTDFAFGEIRDDSINSEMNATIIEVAYHDDSLDAEILRDPKGRDWIGRAAYQATVRYFNEFDGATLSMLPEPPTNLRVIATGVGQATLSWAAPPVDGIGGDAATGYVVYRSSNGYGFGNATILSGVGTTSLIVNGLTPDQVTYFRVAATNAGGESFPTETLAVRPHASGSSPVLVVNGFDRLQRSQNPRETSSVGIGGTTNGPQTYDRVKPRKSNSADYIVQHAAALDACTRPFDSCTNEAVIAGQVSLSSYYAVVWILGEESTADGTFNSTEQSLVTTYLSGGGRLFASGAEIGWDLEAQGNGTTFYNSTLKSDYVADDAATYNIAGGTSIFSSVGAFSFDNGTNYYDVEFPDTLAGINGSAVCMTYSGGAGAALQYPTGLTGGSIVMMGFPFETITSSVTRNQVMSNVMTFFGTPVPVSVSLFLTE